MSLEQLRKFLLPVAPEKDEGFRAEIEALGRRGLRVIGWVQIVMPLLATGVYHFIVGLSDTASYYFLYVLLSVLLGIATMSCSLTARGSKYARQVGLLSGGASVWLGLSGQVYMIEQGLANHLSGSMTILVVILVGLAVLPLKPIHGFAMGFLAGVIYYGFIALGLAGGTLLPEHLITEEFIGLPLVILMYTALTAVAYQRLASSWKSRVETLEAAEELRRSESRTLIAESAAGMNRLAAAVSHELNSPLGAMKSASESLPLAVRRLCEAEPAEREKLVNIADTLAGTVSISAARMQEIVGRMQRFTNLDRSEVLTVDVNELLSDVAAFVTAEADGKTGIDAKLEALPRIRSRPQQLSAVFSSLLHLAVDRAGAGGAVGLRTRHAGPQIEVSVSDSGAKLSPQEVAHLFDPEFRVSGDRVTTGDWNLFGARRLVHEAGGDIRGEDGNTFVVTLPCAAERV